MASFQYVARKVSGEQVTGVVEAASQREVLQKLAEDSLFTVKIEEAKTTRILSNTRVRPRHTAVMFNQLADLLRSGVPLLRSLEILDRQGSNASLSKTLAMVRGDVADGSSLADAMGRHPNAFGELSVSMVRAGEEGGFLEDVLSRIAEFTDHQEELKSKVIGALAYPMFLLTVTFIVLIVMMTVFVPRFAEIFDRLRKAGNLPVITEMLLSTSAFIQSHNLIIIAALVLLVGSVSAYFKTERGRWNLDRFKLKAPVLSRIWLGLAIARFSRILGTMLHNGIPILTALRISKDSAGNKVLATAIDKAAENVTSGNALAMPLKASGYFPLDIIEMISVGEESNNLEEVLIGIADTTERRITRNMDLMVRLLEPLLLLVMAVITLIVVAGLLLPIFRMGSLV